MNKTPEEIISMRRLVIDRFHRLNCAPTVTINMDAFIEPALQLKDRLNQDERAKKSRITLNHIILKATAMALREDIFFNYDYDGKYRIYPNDRIDIRTPVDLGDFPVHIVIPETDKKSIFEISYVFNERLEEVKKNIDTKMKKYVDFQLKRKGLSSLVNLWTEFARRARPLFPAWEKRWFEIQHRYIGTFMVTNMGTLGVIDCHGQLVKPSIAALLVLSTRDVVSIVDNKPLSRKYLGLALEFDHRVVDAAEAGRFLQKIKRNIEEPEKYCL